MSGEPYAQFSDPRLVALYDAVNGYEPGTQPDFYAGLAAELGATTIVDLGCGTGLLTCVLARQGHRVIGVEPAPAMLAVARRRPGCEGVRWIEGDAGAIGTPGADLAVMAGHVAQFHLADEEWHAALVALHDALRPGGHLAFESRDPDARGWSDWSGGARRVVEHPELGRIEVWAEVDEVADGLLTYRNRYALASGEVLESRNRLRFRSMAELERSLGAAGFSVERAYGHWDRRPVGGGAPELIVVAGR